MRTQLLGNFFMSDSDQKKHPLAKRKLTLIQKAKHDLRLDKIEKLMMQGVTSHSEIANMFGVSRMTVIRWLKQVNERLRREKPTEVEDARNLRVAQLSNIFRNAMVAWEKSGKESVEEQVDKVRCRMCNGEGTVEERPSQWEDCPQCNGKGLLVDRVIKKVKTTPGDSAYLRVAKDVVLEIAKIEGVTSSDSKLISTRLLQTSTGAPDDLKHEIRQLYIEAPEDTIIKAMLALEELDLSRQKKQGLHHASAPNEPGRGAKVEVIDAYTHSDHENETEGPQNPPVRRSD